MKKIFFLGLITYFYLIFPSFCSNIEEHKDVKNIIFYNLTENIKIKSDIDKTTYLKNAFMADEEFSFTEEFLNQTAHMKKREANFRVKCNIAEVTNIAQICIYGIYKNSSSWKVVETFNQSQCKGCFYLSGTTPTSFSQEKPKSNISGTIHTQKIGYEKGFIEVHQRPQPIVTTIRDTLKFLVSIKDFVENPNEETLKLSKLADQKNDEILLLDKNKNQIIFELNEYIKKLMNEKGGIAQIAQKLSISILRELITCLEDDDLYFYGMHNTKENQNIKEFIESIQKELVKSEKTNIQELKEVQKIKKLDKLLNSKHFNLGCSEPLLLFHNLTDDLGKLTIINAIKKSLLNKEEILNKKKKNKEKIQINSPKELESIIIQLHSTKTPCISCLIGICGHACSEIGSIKTFFSSLREKLNIDENVSLRFLVSYDTAYKTDYPFLIPVAKDLLSLPSSSDILLVNMQYHDEVYKDIKSRIMKEIKQENLYN